MLFADAFAISLVVLGTVLGLVSFWIAARVLWPARVEAARAQLETKRWTSFFIGLVPVGVVLGLLAALGSVGGPVAALALVLSAVFFFYCQVGVAGLAAVIGDRLADLNTEPVWRTQRRGAIILALSFLFPLLGWLGLTVATLIMGAGAMVRTQFGGRPKTEDKTNPPPLPGD